MSKENAAPKKEKKKGGGGVQFGQLDPPPAYLAERLALWDQWMAEAKTELAAKSPTPIKITLPDGSEREGESWRTTPIAIAQGISQGLADSTIVAKVNGELWDLDRPFESDARLQLLKFDDEEAKAVFWHSSAHMLGEAMERCHGGCLCYGPPIKPYGFYYDAYLGDGVSIPSSEFGNLDGLAKAIAKEKQPFERLELSKAQLRQLFAYNKFKLRIIDEKVATEKTTAYRCGTLIDLCRGPHVRHTGKVKAFACTKNSSAFWEGKADKEVLQRVYGISFPDPKQLKEWQRLQEEAAARDHRKLGDKQSLFMFHQLSPGSAFWFPKGAHIYNKLMEMIRSEYWDRDYEEIVTPNLYNHVLWETSGHWQHYSDDMFKVECEKEQWALKPMNCPGHCLMFAAKPRTHRSLPLRYADFGVLHRNEISGALSGLTRVRRFQQDDAHIFCSVDQIADEVRGCLEFMKHVYEGVFGFKFHLHLSTRPEKALGDRETWDEAEAQLTKALDTFGHPWSLNPGDGAFYGPKIDVKITDALERQHQCATVQLDFQLPIRFDLNYTDGSGQKHRPVIVHRAILGSIERMTAILIEHFGGKWPFWLSPRQACILPVHESFDGYCEGVRQALRKARFAAEVDLDQSDSLNRKIRNAQLAQFNFILVCGEKEAANGTVNVRTRDNKVRGEIKLDEFIRRLRSLRDDMTLDSEAEWE